MLILAQLKLKGELAVNYFLQYELRELQFVIFN